ncbi:Poly [ADP-ribose] polymerase 2 [Echinococcus granulosus]|uniref:NAD(+) ADP-ribosyltransferase n=1 Tax=Echinococcus granulosus TaxID=6210 RepID=W6U872_ECHGR|nr:Poly [ADP-ribose] polymerase 2 [Echinococcus granulosus]EUB56566.1 Poly [ADP-ribose] polymerase 2 [Echinococcus granulosus]
MILDRSPAKASSAKDVQQLIAEAVLATVWNSTGSVSASMGNMFPRGRKRRAEAVTAVEGGSDALRPMRVRAGAVVDSTRGLEYYVSVVRDAHYRSLSAVLDMVDLTGGSNVNPLDEHSKKLKNRIEVCMFTLANQFNVRAQGVRIAPTKALSTGYMFGKGVYLSDMTSKFANYCYTSPSASQSCLLFCEVALGRLHDCFTADVSRLSKQIGIRIGHCPFSKLLFCSKGVDTTAPNVETHFKESKIGVAYLSHWSASDLCGDRKRPSAQ